MQVFAIVQKTKKRNSPKIHKVMKPENSQLIPEKLTANLELLIIGRTRG